MPLIGDPASAFVAQTTRGKHAFPKSGLVGDHRIAPPVGWRGGSGGAAARSEGGQVECDDRWFCHQKLKENA
jgi:hypothetical protein